MYIFGKIKGCSTFNRYVLLLGSQNNIQGTFMEKNNVMENLKLATLSVSIDKFWLPK